MWDVFGKTDLFLITTNPIVRKDGAAVMGRGIALEAKSRFPELPYKYAKRLALLSEMLGPYNYCDVIDKFAGQSVGFFMVKDHWKEPAKLDIISNSVDELYNWLQDDCLGRVDLNFPGIGNGKLKREDVLPLLERLPNNVHVWEY
jgi:hypothetical protein